MDFTLDEGQQAVADVIGSVLGQDGVLEPENTWKALVDGGVTALGVPERLGGDGVGLVCDELAVRREAPPLVGPDAKHTALCRDVSDRATRRDVAPALAAAPGAPELPIGREGRAATRTASPRTCTRSVP